MAKIDKQDLMEALAQTKPGINRNGSDDSMGYFLFSGKDITTFNNVISIMHPFKTSFKNTFLRGDNLMDILVKARTSKISLEKEDQKVSLKAGKLKAHFATIEDKDYIKIIKDMKKSIKKLEWKDLPDTFHNAAQTCSTVYITSEVDSVLSCMQIKGETCSSSDNQRIVIANLGTKMDEMLIKCSEITKLLSIKPTKYTIGESWLHFKNEKDCIFSIRKVEGEFPVFNEVVKFKGLKVKLPNDLTDGIDATSIFIDSVSPYITLTIGKGVCELSISSKYGDSKYKSKTKYNGKEICFDINPEFLKNMLKFSTKMTVADTNDKMKLTTKDYTIVSALYGEE